jgi:hypothetical protein
METKDELILKIDMLQKHGYTDCNYSIMQLKNMDYEEVLFEYEKLCNVVERKQYNSLYERIIYAINILKDTIHFKINNSDDSHTVFKELSDEYDILPDNLKETIPEEICEKLESIFKNPPNSLEDQHKIIDIVAEYSLNILESKIYK